MDHSASQRQQAMARALQRAAELLDGQAQVIDRQVAHWRKDRPRDDAPTVARTLHQVAGQLRGWADDCLATVTPPAEGG